MIPGWGTKIPHALRYSLRKSFYFFFKEINKKKKSIDHYDENESKAYILWRLVVVEQWWVFDDGQGRLPLKSDI